MQGGTFSLEGLDQASQIRYLWRENLNLREMTSELKAELLEFRNMIKQIEGVAEDSSGEKSEPARDNTAPKLQGVRLNLTMQKKGGLRESIVGKSESAARRVILTFIGLIEEKRVQYLFQQDVNLKEITRELKQELQGLRVIIQDINGVPAEDGSCVQFVDGRGSAVIEKEVVDLEPNGSNCLAEEAEGFLATKIWDPGGGLSRYLGCWE